MSTTAGSDTVTTSERKRTAGAFDIRLIIALLFALFGVVVTAVGLVATGPDDIAKAAGINVNLDAGIAMLVFAAGFAAWARLRPIAVPQEAQQEGEDAS